MRFPSSSRAPGPTANTRPRCGFSLAVSGRTIPLTVNSSSSRTSTIKRSPSGCRFMKASLKGLSRNGFCAELSRGPRTAPPGSDVARALRERGNPVRDCRAAGLAGDHRACCDLRGVRECAFELLLPHPLCGQPGRLVRLRRTLEKPHRGQNAPTGVDQVVAAEPRQLAQPRQQAVANLSRHFLGAHLVDPLVAAHSRIHVIASISLDLPTATPETGPPMHLNLVCKSERKLGASTASALGLRAFQLYLKICAEDHKLLDNLKARTSPCSEKEWPSSWKRVSRCS